jgi:hypothetical protein
MSERVHMAELCLHSAKMLKNLFIETISGASLMQRLTYDQRIQLIAGYAQMIEEIIENDRAKVYYVNFMFNQLPGSDRTRREIMKREVARFHDILTNHTVRKRKAQGWRDLVPVLIGAPDYPVIKKEKADAKLYQVNEGLHFNAIVLVPPRKRPSPNGKRSRMKESLGKHLKLKSELYLTSRLGRIDVTPVELGTTMTDYALKAFRRGRISSDDILVLNS